MLRRVLPSCLLPVLVSSLAFADVSPDAARMDAWALSPSGSENLLLDVAVMPQTYYRRDALGSPLTGVRLAAWVNLASRSLADGKLRIVTSFRYDLDTGADIQKTFTNTLYAPNNYSILATYIEYDPVSDLRLRVGRQFYADMASYLAFDGARILWKLPVPLQLDFYGGVRSTVVVAEGSIASSLFLIDGVPQSEIHTPQPVFGAALRWVGNMQAREEASLGYRQSWGFVQAGDLTSLGVPGVLHSSLQTTAQELVATAARDFHVLYVAGGLAYEIALDRIERARLSLVFPFSRFVPVPFLEKNRRLDLSLDYQRYQPTFALDSIWNFFTSYAFDEVAAAAAFQGGTLTLQATAFGRFYYAAIYDRNNNVIPTSPGRQYAAGGRVSSTWAFSGADLLDGGVMFQDGFGGRDLYVNAGWRHRFELPLEVYGRASVTNWSQSVIATNAGSSFGFVAGGTWHFPEGASASLILEEVVAAAGTGTTLFLSPIPRVYVVVDLTRWL